VTSHQKDARLCLVEDDPVMGESLTYRFSLEGIPCDWHHDARSALHAIDTENYGAIISDIRLPDLTGEDLFKALLKRDVIPPPILFITGYGSIDQAVRLIRLGARDYITKPFDLEQLLDKLRTLCPVLFADGLESCPEPVLGVSPVMHRLEETLRRVADYRASVLFAGESGVGKEHAALYLHHCSDPLGKKPFVPVNCAAVHENLLEAELFGHEKGAFTGAVRTHRGVFERAHGGTLFLDEVSDMAPAMQAKLLRAIQGGVVQRVGGEEDISADVRLVCATNHDLKQMVEAGNFREDLFYRINVIHVHIPPLRERKEDILWFAHRFVEDYARENAVRRYLLPVVEQYLLDELWPGNLRELQHMIERACILGDQEMLGLQELLGALNTEEQPDIPRQENLKVYLEQCERRLIQQTLEAHQWRIVESASNLGISRKNLWEKIKKFNLKE
jgi:DNA-binding NtrC family response regulator